MLPVEQHRVSKAEESVSEIDRLLVGRPQLVDSGEGHDESQHRAPRQVEIREERIHGPEPVARRDEDLRLSADALPTGGVG